MILTKHVLQRIADRGVISPADVLRIVNSRESEIAMSSAFEVWVIIRRYSVTIETADGYKGSVVVACCDPRNRTVKTILLLQQAQIKRTSAHEVIGG